MRCVMTLFIKQRAKASIRVPDVEWIDIHFEDPNTPGCIIGQRLRITPELLNTNCPVLAITEEKDTDIRRLVAAINMGR